MKASGFGLVLASAITATASARRTSCCWMRSGSPANSETGCCAVAGSATMTQVQEKFGPPTTIMDAVGEPPITRWVYPGYGLFRART